MERCGAPGSRSAGCSAVTRFIREDTTRRRPCGLARPDDGKTICPGVRSEHPPAGRVPLGPGEVLRPLPAARALDLQAGVRTGLPFPDRAAATAAPLAGARPEPGRGP